MEYALAALNAAKREGAIQPILDPDISAMQAIHNDDDIKLLVEQHKLHST